MCLEMEFSKITTDIIAKPEPRGIWRSWLEGRQSGELRRETVAYFLT